MKNLESVLFDIAAGAGRLAAFASTHPTEYQRASQEDLARVLEGAPLPHLSEADIDAMARTYDRLDPEHVREGRISRPFRTNPHGV